MNFCKHLDSTSWNLKTLSEITLYNKVSVRHRNRCRGEQKRAESRNLSPASVAIIPVSPTVGPIDLRRRASQILPSRDAYIFRGTEIEISRESIEFTPGDKDDVARRLARSLTPGYIEHSQDHPHKLHGTFLKTELHDRSCESENRRTAGITLSRGIAT